VGPVVEFCAKIRIGFEICRDIDDISKTDFAYRDVWRLSVGTRSKHQSQLPPATGHEPTGDLRNP
jgi:hypothetical protein